MELDIIVWLQEWFESQCNDDWEHTYGVRIDTLDNPGWRFRVNIEGTELEGIVFEPINIDRSEHDWLRCRVDKGEFNGAGGPLNLFEILKIFRSWAESVKE